MKQEKIYPVLWEDISKYKNEIYGFSILWILFFHAIAMLDLNYSMGKAVLIPLHSFISYGNMGVEIFLFCSGICLYFSYYRNPDILRFLKKRFFRLFWPVLFISVGYWIGVYLIQKGSIALFFSKLTMLDFWISGDQQMWFVSLILICYLLYPYIFEIIYKEEKGNEKIRIVCLVIGVMLLTWSVSEVYPELYGKIEIALTRFPIFLLGCFAGKFVYERKTLPGTSAFVFLALDLIVPFILYLDVIEGPWRRWFYMLGGIPMTFTIAIVLKWLNWRVVDKFLAFFGKISLNIYIAHVVVIRIYKMTPLYDNCRLLHYGGIIIISILLAWLAEKVIDRLGLL